MLRTRIKLSLGLLLILSALELTAAAAFDSDPAHYLSAIAYIQAKGFVSLEAAFKSIAAGLTEIGFTLRPVLADRYHMTIASFNVKIAPGLTNTQRQRAADVVAGVLKTATETALAATLAHLEAKRASAAKAAGRVHHGAVPTPIVLSFDHLAVFERYLVAIFNATGVVKRLITEIEREFRVGLAHLRGEASHWITGVEPQYAEFEPHVSLAKFTSAHELYGLELAAPTAVKDFHISRPEVEVSVQVRDGAPGGAAAAAGK